MASSDPQPGDLVVVIRDVVVGVDVAVFAGTKGLVVAVEDVVCSLRLRDGRTVDPVDLADITSVTDHLRC